MAIVGYIQYYIQLFNEFIKVFEHIGPTLLEREFYKEGNDNVDFHQIAIFEEITKNTFIAIILSKQARKGHKFKILKIAFGIDIGRISN